MCFYSISLRIWSVLPQVVFKFTMPPTCPNCETLCWMSHTLSFCHVVAEICVHLTVYSLGPPFKKDWCCLRGWHSDNHSQSHLRSVYVARRHVVTNQDPVLFLWSWWSPSVSPSAYPMVCVLLMLTTISPRLTSLSVSWVRKTIEFSTLFSSRSRSFAHMRPNTAPFVSTPLCSACDFESCRPALCLSQPLFQCTVKPFDRSQYLLGHE